MTSSVANVTSGPAQLLIADADAGHTEGGLRLNQFPKLACETSICTARATWAIIHDGDTVRVHATFAEWVAMPQERLQGWDY